MSIPMKLADSRRLDLNAKIDALVLAGDSDALLVASADVVDECARRYVVAQINSKGRRSVRSLEQFAKVREESKEKTASRIRNVVASMEAELLDDWNAKLLAEQFVLPDGTWVSWGEATVHDHRVRAEYLEGLAAGSVETASIHRRAISDCLDAHVNSLAGIR
jgi:hypothetical protein